MRVLPTFFKFAGTDAYRLFSLFSFLSFPPFGHSGTTCFCWVFRGSCHVQSSPLRVFQIGGIHTEEFDCLRVMLDGREVGDEFSFNCER